MKKALVVIILFALPIVAYLFFSSGVNSFAKLPVYNEDIGTLQKFTPLNEEEVSFQNKITLLGFFGKDIDGFKGHAFNVNQKIYKRYHQFKDFQFVVAVPEGSQEQVRGLIDELDNIADVSKWKFVFGSEEDVQALYNSLNPTIPLDNNLATPYVFIVDKNGNLRGRKDAEEDLVPHGYNTASIAELGDKLNDDIKVILAEYRLELKKYNKNAED